MRQIRASVLRFLFPTESDRWLTVLRVGLGFQIICYLLAQRGDWLYLFSSDSSGFSGRPIFETVLSAESSFTARLGWLVNAGQLIHVSESIVLQMVWASMFASACCLVLGFFCRPAAIVAWFLQLASTNSGLLLSYGADKLTTIGLFYLMLAPLPDHMSLDTLRGNRPCLDPQLLGFFRRVLQVHLCLIYLSGGISKCLGPGWWNGDSVWRALTRPPFGIISRHALLAWNPVFCPLGILICIIETGYAFFIWWRPTRLVWLLCVIVMHAAIGILMGLYLFALIMITLNLAAFGPDLVFELRETIRSGSSYGRRYQTHPEPRHSKKGDRLHSTLGGGVE